MLLPPRRDGRQQLPHPLHATERYFLHECAESRDASCASSSSAAAAAAAAQQPALLQMDLVCRESDLRSWKQRHTPSTLFPRVGLCMEDDPAAQVFYVSEYVLHSMSKYYEGMAEFGVEQQHMARARLGEEGETGAGCFFHDADAGVRRLITIPSEVTKDPRVVDSAIFFMYTRVPFDVRGKDEGSIATQTFSRIEFSFDVMELYALADYLDIHELTELVQMGFFGTATMFTQTGNAANAADRLHEAEERVAKMIIKCQGLRSSVLFHSLAQSYAEGTGGLACLCRWPTRYPRSTWDGMMKAAMPYSILWVAHVLPLYAIMFRLSPEESLQLLASMQLPSWLDGDNKSISVRQLVRSISPHFFRHWRFQAGTVAMNSADIPDTM